MTCVLAVIIICYLSHKLTLQRLQLEDRRDGQGEFPVQHEKHPNTRKQYTKQLLEKAEEFIKRLGWKALFFLNPDSKPDKKETCGLKIS